MIPTFVIFLREGVEASMIIAILLAYLDRIGKRAHFRDVFWGVAAAFVLVLGGGIAAYYLIKHYDGSDVQTIFETTTYLLAAAILTYMTFWMQKNARGLTHELERRSQDVLSTGSRWGLALLAFQAVGREGLETMVFTLAIIFASSRQAATPVHGNLLIVGAALGLLVAMAVAFAIYRLGTRINMRRFFRVLGVTLMVFAAGLLSDAVENMQQLGWLPFWRHVVWNSQGVVSEGSNWGDVLHTLVGYADHPTVLQVLVWATYVLASTVVFMRMGTRRRASVSRMSAEPTATSASVVSAHGRPT